ncbi:MAG: hypothetical protein M1827_004286 [Pycnora praestabilis]|nr:MAG: hypothetical protein M1827_004286 [Pycnora praestabilis]
MPPALQDYINSLLPFSSSSSSSSTTRTSAPHPHPTSSPLGIDAVIDHEYFHTSPPSSSAINNAPPLPIKALTTTTTSTWAAHLASIATRTLIIIAGHHEISRPSPPHDDTTDEGEGEEKAWGDSLPHRPDTVQCCICSQYHPSRTSWRAHAFCDHRPCISSSMNDDIDDDDDDANDDANVPCEHVHCSECVPKCCVDGSLVVDCDDGVCRLCGVGGGGFRGLELCDREEDEGDGGEGWWGRNVEVMTVEEERLYEGTMRELRERA